MTKNQKSIQKEDLLKLARNNPSTFYQYLRHSLGQVERIALGKLTNEQLLNLAIEHIRSGTLKFSLDNMSSENYFSVSKNQISESAYMRRARARGAASEDNSETNDSTRESRATPNDISRWIAFQICDDNSGEPLANVELKIQLPDGHVRRFYTDSEGQIKIEGMEYGPLHVLEIKYNTHSMVSQFS